MYTKGLSLGPVSNKADWIEDATLTEDTTGNPVDLSSAEIVLAVEDPCGARRLLASSANTKIELLSVDGNNQFRWTFLAEEMNALEPGVYSVGIAMTIDAKTTQLAIIPLTVVDGVL